MRALASTDYSTDKILPEGSEIASGSLSSLWHRGYRRMSFAPMVRELGLEADLVALTSVYQTMPLDPYDKAGTRFRMYGRGIYSPWSKSLSWIEEPVDADGKQRAPYYQGLHNPEHIDQYRYFAAINQATLRNRALELLAWGAVAQTVWETEDARYPVSIGVHMIAQIVSTQKPRADVSPAVMHQDGEAYDFVLLVGRNGVAGGDSYIGPVSVSGTAPEDVGDSAIEVFTLTEPLSGFGVKDDMVSHGVTPVLLAPGATQGYRYTLLVDATPMRESLR